MQQYGDTPKTAWFHGRLSIGRIIQQFQPESCAHCHDLQNQDHPGSVTMRTDSEGRFVFPASGPRHLDRAGLWQGGQGGNHGRHPGALVVP